MEPLRVILVQAAAEPGLDEVVPGVRALVPGAPSLLLVGGTAPIHGAGKAVVQAWCDETGSTVLRASVDRRERVAFRCVPGQVPDFIYPEGPGVTSARPDDGPFEVLGWRMALGFDDDLEDPAVAAGLRDRGVRLWVVWPRATAEWAPGEAGRFARDRARETGMAVAVLFPASVAGLAAPGMETLLADSSGQLATSLPAGMPGVAVAHLR